MPALFGEVTRVLFSKPEEDFYIFKLQTPGGLVSAKGHVPNLSIYVGQRLGVEGSYKTSKYGKELVIERAPLFSVENLDPLKTLYEIATDRVHIAVLHALHRESGSNFFNRIEAGDFHSLVDHNADQVVADIQQNWIRFRKQRETLHTLSLLDLPSSSLSQIYQRYGVDSLPQIKGNPWNLVEAGICSLKQADNVARRLKVSLLSPNRLNAVVLDCVNHPSMGSLCLDVRDLFKRVKKECPTLSGEQLKTSLQHLESKGKLHIDRSYDQPYIFSNWHFHLEDESVALLESKLNSADDSVLSAALRTYTHSKSEDFERLVQEAVEKWCFDTQIALTETQKTAVINAMVSPISIITGLPGTGKTVTLSAISSILREGGVELLLAAPTGIAAKNLGKKARQPASTIHRAFAGKPSSTSDDISSYLGILERGGSEEDTSSSVWSHNQGNPHQARYVAIDESSMLDQHLLYRILNSTRPDCRFVFVGDVAQLPSVGPGNVLHDLIESKLFPVTSLTEIFRQEETSDIVFAAHDINKGVCPVFPDSQEFVFVETRESECLDMVLAKAQELWQEGVDFQVLSPRHKGDVGVTNLNKELRQLFNPKSDMKSEVYLGGGTARVGDRVMIVSNDYQREIFNGDLATVVDIRVHGKVRKVSIQVKDEDSIIELDLSEAESLLRLAYACTVHKFQGIEIDTIILPLLSSFSRQLQRNLFYTAVTRAKSRVFIIGQFEAMHTAARSQETDKRMTTFSLRLQQKLRIGGVPVSVEEGREENHR